MQEMTLVRWIGELQAIAQNGLTFCKDPYDQKRYLAIRKIAAEIAAHSSGLENTYINDLFASCSGYLTPKLDVRAAVFQQDSVLLVKETMDGLWALPGGWIDVNDSPSEAVVREVLEETGYLTRAVKLLALYDSHKHAHPPRLPHAHKCFFLCDIISGEPRNSIETSAIAFFKEDQLPNLSLPRVTYQQIHRIFEHYKHREWPTDFD